MLSEVARQIHDVLAPETLYVAIMCEATGTLAHMLCGHDLFSGLVYALKL